MLDVWPVGLKVRFTPGGAVGSVGPTLEQVRAILPTDSAIRNHPDFRVDGGVITLPLLPTGDYQITIAGASGRNISSFGGKGMILTYRVRYSASSSAPWRLIVGQMHSGLGVGGGSGSFMFQGEELLLVAGGGGSHAFPGRGIIADDPGTNGRNGAAGACRDYGGKGWREIANYLSGGPIASDYYSFGGGCSAYAGGGGGYSGGSDTGGGSSFAHPSAALVQPASATNIGSGFIEIQRIV